MNVMMTVDYRLDMYYILYPLTFLCNRGRPEHDGMVVSQCLSLTFWVRIPICDSNCLPFRSTCVHPRSYLSGVPVFTLDVYYMYMLYHSTVLCYSGRPGRDRMVFIFANTYAVSTFHH
jgi:hypothetical protein